MKYLAAITLLFTFALAAVPVQAERHLSGRIGLYNPEEKGFDTGFNLGFAYGLSLGELLPESVKQNPELAKVTTEFGIGIYNSDFQQRFIGEIDLTVIPITVTAIYNLPIDNSPIELYAGAGPGLYFAMVDTPFGDDSDLEFGIHLLGGAALNVDRQLDLFVEVRGDFVSDDVGGSFLNLGAKYRF